MKIFGLEITSRSREMPSIVPESPPIPVREAIPVEQVVPSNTKSPAAIKKLKSPAIIYSTARGLSVPGQFRSPEYSLVEIGRIEDVEGYVRQAFKKKVGLMFKEGYSFASKNKKHLKYIKARFRQIERASGIPTGMLLRSIGRDLIRVSNAFLVKVRNEEASGGKVRKDPGRNKELKPTAAYFPLPAEMMEAEVDEFGNVTRYRQNMPDGKYKIWNKDDIVHFYFDRKHGFVFGTPTLIPAIDDIRALRQMEENLELLVHQFLFPLFHCKVGTKEAPAGVMENGQREIDYARDAIEYIPAEGGFVTDYRYEIQAIGAEGRALRAEGYLQHFKERVVSDLGLSSVDLGQGDTANRSTAGVLSQILVDDVKDFQSVLEEQFNSFIIIELLLESTFDSDEFFTEEGMVSLKFSEIDLENKVKRETHAADLFVKYGLTLDELRIALGREPIAIPTVSEIVSGEAEEGLEARYPDWYRTWWKLFEEPKLLMQSIDEPYSQSAQAAAKSRSTSLQPGDLQAEQENADAEAEEERKSKERLAKYKTKPKATPARKSRATSSNQHGSGYQKAKSSFEHEIEDNAISFAMEEFRTYASQNKDIEWLQMVANSIATQLTKDLFSDIRVRFSNGFMSVDKTPEKVAFALANKNEVLRSRVSFYVEKLFNNIVNALRRNQFDTLPPESKISLVNAVFDSLKYRADLILSTEPEKAFNLGMLEALKSIDKQAVVFRSTIEACEECKNHLDHEVPIMALDLENISPFHPHCRCKIVRGI